MGISDRRIFKDQADIDNHADQWDVTSYPGDRPIEPGDLKYKDLDNNGKINNGSWTVNDPGDYKVIGNNASRYNYGADFTAEWNGLDFRVLLQGVGKRIGIRKVIISLAYIELLGEMCLKII